jgi:hypothetical protein
MNKVRAKTKRPSRPRPKMPPVSEEMKQWSALLRQELNTWPKVVTKPMFGFLGFYHRGKIFAAIPVTRAMNTPNTLIFKCSGISRKLIERAQNDTRIELSSKAPGAGWHSFELRSEGDIRDALWWLNHAYEAAKS